MYNADFKQFMKYSYSSCSKDNFKSIKVFFYIYIIFFLYLRITNKYYQKYKEKLRKKTWKIPESFWRKKKTKIKQTQEKCQNFIEEEKEKLSLM